MDIPAIVFGLLAWLGHSLIVIFSHNRFYGLPLSHKTTDGIQFVHFLWLVLGPVGLFLAWSKQVPGMGGNDPVWLVVVLWICFLAAVVGFPVDCIRRYFRRGRGAPLPTKTVVLPIANSEEALLELRGPGIRGLMCQIPGNLSLKPVLHHFDLKVEGLPKVWDGLTILHLSDLHTQKNPTAPFFKALAKALAPLQPDIIAFSGDLVEKENADHLEVFSQFLGGLKFREAGLAILGNHDFWHPVDPTISVLKQHGYLPLGNQRKTIQVRGETLHLMGLEYPWNPETPQGWGETHPNWTLCLSHTPDHFPQFASDGPGLMLAGHVHGGQICFPGFGPVIMPSVYGRYYDQGFFQKGQAFLHVSEGISGGHPLRFGLHPAASLITLRTGPSKSGFA